jgi:hypothetical protein
MRTASIQSFDTQERTEVRNKTSKTLILYSENNFIPVPSKC